MKCYIILILYARFIAMYCIKNESNLVAEGILGGDVAENGQFKYMVSVQADGYHYCGGSIIGEQHVLTAAHCLIDTYDNFYTEYKLTVVAGVIEAMTKARTVLRLKVQKAYVPREFTRINPNPGNIIFRETGDIAVLKLDKPFGNRNRAVKILQLPSKDSCYGNAHAIVTGYGYEELFHEQNLESDQKVKHPVIGDFKLKYGETLVLTNVDCQPKQDRLIYPSHICALMKQRNSFNSEGVCIGDSGGPLVLNGDTVIGVVSYCPISCKESVAPSIYTRVTSFLTFLDKAKNDLNSPDIRTHKY